MAEFVQHNIEDMVNELEQMQRVGLFDRHEIRKIIKKRKALEYKLRRRTKQKEDYLSYAQYEINLLALVKKRREIMGYNFKKVEIDLPIVQRIHMLFKLATFRFQDDVKLWLSHIEFSKKRNEKLLVSKMYSRMLQVHAHKPALWIAAAKWEFEERKATDNARGLMQRGLRFNETSEKLWLEYFKLELLLIDLAKKRNRLLHTGTSLDEDSSDAFLSGKVAEIVFLKAMETLPGDVDFGLAFAKVASLFDFGKSLEQTIHKYLVDRYNKCEQIWVEKARQVQRSLKEDCGAELVDNESYAVLEDAVRNVRTGKMWQCYLQFVWDSLNKEPTLARSLHMIQLLNRAHSHRFLSEEWYSHWLKILEDVGLLHEAEAVIGKALNCFPHSVAMWKKRLEFYIGCHSSDSKIMGIFDEAISAVDAKISLPLWRLCLMHLVQSEDATLPEQLFKRGLSLAMSEEVLVPIKEMYMDWTILKCGINKGRTVYKELCLTSPLSLSFYLRYIAAESSQVRPKIKKIRKAFDEAVRNFGSTSVDLWLQYIQIESSHHSDSLRAGQLYWQALKTLDGSLTEVFTARHVLMQTCHESAKSVL